MPDGYLRALIFGAHPDDPESCAGGVAYKYAQHGHRVRMVSLTNGGAGGVTMYGPALAARRREEAAAAGRVLEVENVVLDNPDAERGRRSRYASR